MTPVTTPVQSESEEEEEEQEPLPIKSPYQRKKEQEKAVRATSLKEIIEDLKNQIETINTKEIPALVEEKNKASKEFTKAKKDWRETSRTRSRAARVRNPHRVHRAKQLET